MEIQGVGGEFYEVAFEGMRMGAASPYKKIREWAKQYDFIDGRYVRVKSEGRNTDLRTIGLHAPEDRDIFHKKFPNAFYVYGERYGILLRPRGRQTRMGGARRYHVASVLGLENLDMEYGNLVDDEEFEFVAQELNAFTDIDSFLSTRNVYVDQVNADNAGHPTFKYRKTAEPERETSSE